MFRTYDNPASNNNANASEIFPQMPVKAPRGNAAPVKLGNSVEGEQIARILAVLATPHHNMGDPLAVETSPVGASTLLHDPRVLRVVPMKWRPFANLWTFIQPSFG